MSSTQDYEIIDLPDGQYEVRILGGVALPQTFGTPDEARRWIAEQSTDLETLKPGMGQGIS